jgi:hypothetical protein
MKSLLPLILSVLAFSQTPTFTHNRFTENGKTFSQDGAHLIGLCLSPEPPTLAPDYVQISFWQDRMLCGGYVEGVADLLSDTSVCIPPETAGKELEKVVATYAAKHEDKMHGAASRIVSSALQEAYPCLTKK